MLRRLLLLLPLLLTACAGAPVIVYVTPPANTDSVLLPEQIQRAADAYTATARAQATQAAQTTATDQSSRATATTARMATLDALAGRQTEAALSLTQQAGQAGSTVTTAVQTERAGQTQAWATPSAVAVRTQAALSAAASAQAQADSASVSEFWRTLRFVILALLIVGGLTVVAVAGYSRYTAVQIARMRETAAVAQSAFRVLAPGHWAEYTPDEGYQVYQLPGGTDEPPTIIENAVANPSRLHAWRQAVRLAGWWAERYGFGIRDIGPPGRAVISDGHWRQIFGGGGVLRVAGAVVDRPTEGEKGKKAGWAPEWSYARLSDDLSHGRLDHLFPADLEVPKVAFTVPTTPPQHASVPRQHVN